MRQTRQCPKCGARMGAKLCARCEVPYQIGEEKLEALRRRVYERKYLQLRGLNAKWRLFSEKSSMSPQVRARVMRRFFQYLSVARIEGKDISTRQKRQPYLLAAMRWEQETPEKLHRTQMKMLCSARDRHNYYKVMSGRAKARLKGEGR